jgi:hypothetical protein
MRGLFKNALLRATSARQLSPDMLVRLRLKAHRAEARSAKAGGRREELCVRKAFVEFLKEISNKKSDLYHFAIN